MGFVYTVQGSLPGTLHLLPYPAHSTHILTRFSVVSLECLATLAEGKLMGEGLSQGALPPTDTLHHTSRWFPEAWGVRLSFLWSLFISLCLAVPPQILNHFKASA